ncbi:MAG: endonuclease/exonuclease/phosphatase family protein [Flavobacteriales bacterium]
MRSPWIFCLLCMGLLAQQRCSRPDVHVETAPDAAPASETSGPLNVAFYNVENLFDTVDDPQTDDQQFLPSSEKEWTQKRFATKIDHLAEVLSQMFNNDLPDVIGVCEVENRTVLEALVAHPLLTENGYDIVHRNSPDGRGIDCALLFNPSRIQIDKSAWHKVVLPVRDRKNTRDIVYARGISGDDTLHFFVNHWPSRYGGKDVSEPRRLTAAYLLDNAIDSIRKAVPGAQVLCMGDFNDHPNDKSIQQVLGANISKPSQLFNFMAELHKEGGGTYNYKGDWGALDQFIGTWNFIDGEAAFKADRQAAEPFRREFMMYVNDRGEAYPSRTYGGPNYYGGYSDHLPIKMTLIQQ